MKIAIVGCGQIADAHIQEIKKIPKTDLVAVCDTNKFMAQQAAIRFSIKNYYTDLKQLLNAHNPDVIHVTTPPATHWPIAKIALEHGIHLYMEKPFCLNSIEAEQMIDCAKKKGKLICAGHNNLFDPSFLRLKRLARKNIFGKIVHIDTNLGYNLSGPFGKIIMDSPENWVHKLPGGLSQNNLSHPISHILDFMPDHKIDIHAYGYRFRKQRFHDIRDKFFDEIRVFLVGEEVTGSLNFSCHRRPIKFNTSISGTKSSAIVSLDSRTLKIIKPVHSPGPLAKLEWAKNDFKESGKEYFKTLKNLIFAKLHFFESMHILFSSFYNAIRGYNEMPIPMEEALRLTNVMDKIIRECEINDQSLS